MCSGLWLCYSIPKINVLLWKVFIRAFLRCVSKNGDDYFLKLLNLTLPIFLSEIEMLISFSVQELNTKPRKLTFHLLGTFLIKFPYSWRGWAIDKQALCYLKRAFCFLHNSVLGITLIDRLQANCRCLYRIICCS